MKKASIFTLLLAAVALVGMSFTNPENDRETKVVNVKESKVIWNGYKVTGSHTGTIQVKSGNLEFADGMLTGGEFVIDMNAIVCTDLTGDTNKKLVGHLKSDDFFGVAKHPTASFKITQVVSRGTPGDYKIVGNLTIKETTKQIKFFTKVTEEGGKKKAVAEVKVDRSDFSVRYGSGSFFDNLGDKTIYDEFDLQVELVANN